MRAAQMRFAHKTHLLKSKPDWQKCLALERALEILGEAVKRLPIELCERYPSVPWKLMAGMRDRMAHGYDAVDYETLWYTGRKDMPPLLSTVEQILLELKKEEPG